MITNFNSSVQAKIIQTGNGSEVEIDLADLRLSAKSADKRPRAAAASPVQENPRVADFKKRRAYPVAANGESHPDANSMGTRPQKKQVLYPIKTKTHFSHRQKFRERAGKGCTDKIRYHTHAEAYEVIRGIVNKPGKKKFRSLKSYSCPNCKGWHIHST